MFYVWLQLLWPGEHDFKMLYDLGNRNDLSTSTVNYGASTSEPKLEIFSNVSVNLNRTIILQLPDELIFLAEGLYDKYLNIA